MHSSRMHTGRSLTICLTLLRRGGVSPKKAEIQKKSPPQNWGSPLPPLPPQPPLPTPLTPLTHPLPTHPRTRPPSRTDLQGMQGYPPGTDLQGMLGYPPTSPRTDLQGMLGYPPPQD